MFQSKEHGRRCETSKAWKTETIKGQNTFQMPKSQQTGFIQIRDNSTSTGCSNHLPNWVGAHRDEIAMFASPICRESYFQPYFHTLFFSCGVAQYRVIITAFLWAQK